MFQRPGLMQITGGDYVIDFEESEKDQKFLLPETRSRFSELFNSDITILLFYDKNVRFLSK